MDDDKKINFDVAIEVLSWNLNTSKQVYVDLIGEPIISVAQWRPTSNMVQAFQVVNHIRNYRPDWRKRFIRCVFRRIKESAGFHPDALTSSPRVALIFDLNPRAICLAALDMKRGS